MKSLITLICIASSLIAQAQTTDVSVENAMRSNGGIYIVIGVLSIIFIGIFCYLLSIDRKLTKFERNQEHE